MDGTFQESPTDDHVSLRSDLLAGDHPLPQPATVGLGPGPVAFGPELLRSLTGELRTSGLAVIELVEPLAAKQYLSLGSHLGTPTPETDPAVQSYVECSVLLNLISEHGHTADGALQPFATTYLTLHTESSGRPAARQPRFISLMCFEPGDTTTAAQTLLVSAKTVAERLSDADQRILAHTRYRNTRGSPPLLRRFEGRPVFSFRDFGPEVLEWTHTGDAGSDDEVNRAIARLLAAMYQPAPVAGLKWRRGMLMVMDNTFFFHGRTAGSSVPSSRRRHLQRLRIR